MKKGFTLLELIVVIVIIGILATLGFAQYTRMIERSRGAEARSVLGAIRTQAAALWVEKSSGSPPVMPTAVEFTNTVLGIGPDAGKISSGCATAAGGSFYFSYNVTSSTTTGLAVTATRCQAGGKTPVGPAGAAQTLILTSNFQTGIDGWTGTGGY